MPLDILNPVDAAAARIDDAAAETVAHGMPSMPTGALDAIPSQPDEPRHWYDFVLLAQKLDDLNDRLARLTEIEQALLNDRIKERTFVDTPVQISAHVEYTVDYLERRYLYLYSVGSLTLVLSNGGTLAISANSWSRISFPRGTKLTAQGVADSAPAAVIIRACDFFMG
jgi:hypothetical protein